MPRKARCWEPGGILHVDARGWEGLPVFAEDDDREFALRAAAKVFRATHTRVLAWAILSNHYHLLIQCDSTPPAVVMHRLNTRIAHRTRQRRGERGAVFQDRYFSRHCTDDRGYEELLAYVLGNPLRHRVVDSVEELERHPWSGLGELLGTAPPRRIDTASVLGHFHDDPDVARSSLRGLVRNKAACWTDTLGDPDELPEVRAPTGGLSIPPRTLADENLRRGLRGVVGIVDPVVGDWNSRTGRRLVLERDGLGPASLVSPVCVRLGADPAGVLSGRRSAPESSARAVVAFLACDYASFPAADVARLTGVASSSLAEARDRGRRIVERLGWDPGTIVMEVRNGLGR